MCQEAEFDKFALRGKQATVDADGRMTDAENTEVQRSQDSER